MTAYRQHTIQTVTGRLKGRMSFPQAAVTLGPCKRGSPDPKPSDARPAGQATPRSPYGPCKHRASFRGARCRAESSVRTQGTWPDLLRAARSPQPGALRSGSVELSVLGGSWSSTLQTKLSSEKKKHSNRKGKFYVRIQVLAIERMGKKKKWQNNAIV